MYQLYKGKCNEDGITNPVTESFYQYIFNTQYNFSFRTSETDTCYNCDAFSKRLRDSENETDMQTVTQKRYKQHQEAKRR